MSARTTRRSRDELPQREPPAWVLSIVHCPIAALREREVLIADSFSIGRDADAGVTLCIDDSELSRRHFTLTRTATAVTLSDEASTNGTFVDGQRVSTSAVLQAGAVIRAGQTVFVLDHQPRDGASDSSEMIGRSAASVHMRRAIHAAAAGLAPILLQGETGTGKELAAREVHERSARRGPLVPVNCGAIPAELAESHLFGHHKGAFTGASADAIGHFAAAKNGTIFLDEIAELPLVLQPKLLRVLDSGTITPVGSTTSEPVAARVVAATNVDLAAAVAAGTFRRDLYARLAALVIVLPPLRERRRDVLPLLHHFLAKLPSGSAVRFTARFAELLLLHEWPMNVREVRSLAYRMTTGTAAELGESDAIAFLGTAGRPRTSAAPDAREPSLPELEAALARFAGNVTDIATHFARNPKQVYRWLERHGLDPQRFRTPRH